jgi:hypothetical protein
MIEREHRAVFTEQLQQRRRRGRPRRSVPIVVTSVKLPQDVYDALCVRALRERESIHSLVRQALTSYVLTAALSSADFK